MNKRNAGYKKKFKKTFVFFESYQNVDDGAIKIIGVKNDY